MRDIIEKMIEWGVTINGLEIVGAHGDYVFLHDEGVIYTYSLATIAEHCMDRNKKSIVFRTAGAAY